MAITAEARSNIIKLVVGMFGAAPGANILSQLVAVYESGATIAQIAGGLATKAQFTQLYPTFLTNQEFADRLAENMLGSEVTAAVKTNAASYIVGRLNAGATRAQVIVEAVNLIDNAPSTGNYANAAKAFDNKVDVATYYTVTKEQSASTLTDLQGVIRDVTSDSATVTAAKAEVDEDSDDVSIGETFTLTTTVDIINGTGGDDTIIADNTGATNQLSAADQINGGAGTDLLKVYVGTATNVETATIGGTLSNIESLFTSGGLLADTKTLDVSTMTGVTAVEIASPSAAMADAATFNLKAGSSQAVTLTKVIGTTGGGTSTVKFTSTANNVTLDGVGTDLTLDFSSTSLSTLNLTTANNNSTVSLANTGGALATVNISGNKNLTLTESLATLKTVNASKATGNVTLDVSGATLDASFAFTGGSGADTVKLKAGALALLTAGSQLDGGAGNDTLSTRETAVLTSAQVAKINAAKNFETLSFGATGSGVDVSTLTSITKFKVESGNFSETFTNSLNGTAYTIDNSAGNTGTVSISNKVGESATAVTVDYGTATAAQTLNNLTLNGITTVSLVSTGTGTGGSNIITTLANQDNSAITITGSKDLTITNALAATATGSKVDASAFTGKLSVTGSSKTDILIGGTNDDTLVSGTGGDTLTGNAGADTFDVKAGVYGATKEVTTITDFVAKTDILKLDDQGTETFTAAKVDTGAATSLASALGLIATGVNGATNAAIKWGQYDGNTYIVEIRTDNSGGVTDAAATDIVVKLTGLVDLSNLTVADFAFA